MSPSTVRLRAAVVLALCAVALARPVKHVELNGAFRSLRAAEKSDNSASAQSKDNLILAAMLAKKAMEIKAAGKGMIGQGVLTNSPDSSDAMAATASGAWSNSDAAEPLPLEHLAQMKAIGKGKLSALINIIDGNAPVAGPATGGAVQVKCGHFAPGWLPCSCALKAQWVFWSAREHRSLLRLR